MVNTLSLGQVKVGKIIGEIQATAGSVGSSELATNAVTTVKITAKNVTSAKIAPAAILSTHYGTKSIDSSNIAVNEVQSSNIGPAELLSTHYGTGSIDSSHIANDEIKTANILAKNITSAKIAVGELLSTHYGTKSIDSSHLAVGEISSSNLASLGIGTTDLAAKGVTQAKISADWSTLANSGVAVSAVTVPAALGGYFLTLNGSSLGMVLASSKLSDPVAGDHYKFSVETTPSTIPIHIKSTSATFDGTNEFILLNAAGDSVWLEAASATRWIIIGGNSYATAAAT